MEEQYKLYDKVVSTTLINFMVEDNRNGGVVLSPFNPDNVESLYAFEVGALTWEGHDFLDNIRNESTWNNIKKIISDKGLPLIIDVIKEVIVIIATAKLNNIIP